MGKPGVMFYFEVRPCLKRMNEHEQCALFNAILDYGEFGTEPQLEGLPGVAWDFLRPRLDRDTERYERVVERNQYAAYTREAKRQNRNALTQQQWKQLMQEKSEPDLVQPAVTNGSQTTNINHQSANNNLQSANTGPSATPLCFSPPGKEEILAYCHEKGYQMDADSFLDYYTANGWCIGKSPMKDWRAAVRRWHRKENDHAPAAAEAAWSVGTSV